MPNHTWIYKSLLPHVPPAVLRGLVFLALAQLSQSAAQANWLSQCKRFLNLFEKKSKLAAVKQLPVTIRSLMNYHQQCSTAQVT